MKVFYFTGTGNGLAIAKALGGEAISITQALRRDTTSYEDDAIGIITPTYCGNPPRIVVDFLRRTTLVSSYRFAIASYGGIMGNPLAPLEKVASEKGWTFDYTNAIKMVDNYLPFFDIDEEREKKSQSQISAEIERVASDVAVRRCSQLKVGGFMSLYQKIGASQYDSFAGPDLARKKFTVNDQCVSCGTCMRFCPGANILVSPGDKPVFGDTCLGCYGCAHICPHNAIHVKGEKSAARWRNPQTTAAELIAANTPL